MISNFIFYVGNYRVHILSNFNTLLPKETFMKVEPFSTYYLSITKNITHDYIFLFTRDLLKRQWMTPFQSFITILSQELAVNRKRQII